ncbi:helix-turn-helix transcriptional regulator [Sandaracinobacter neustonicus]|uniref:Helix-turn-helix transcriptional regulator n=2 Tax=Sandaracinobacter neustonicus TaxID=1715348 RepID=A0A501XHI2_9SPHN|nr:AraC family transcriptional regulator [Brevundimonas sp.]TPE59753.1 helix-turn-helix transcriptional regulator [Sandaracinobacter neustonicus]HBI20132.1 AraC family transcriptional regulator [Brevundimonas sp.]
MPCHPPRLIDFATEGCSPLFERTHRLSRGAIHIARGALTPNPGRRLGAPQLTAVVHEGEPFEMEWREPDTGRLQTALIRTGAVHVNPGDRPFYQRWTGQPRIMVIAFGSDFVEQIGASFGGKTGADIGTVIGRRDAEVEAIAARLRRELADDSEAAQLLAEGLATALLVHLFRTYRRTPNPGTPLKGRMEPRKLADVLDYIDDHLTEKITLDALAAVAGLSPNHFNVSFRTTTGAPPIKFVIRRRLERAMDFLATTDRPISDIAYGLGFPSHGHLSTHFKRVVGIAPSRFRSDWRSKRGGGASGEFHAR